MVNGTPGKDSAVFDDKQHEKNEQHNGHQPEWVPLVAGPFTKQDEFCVDVRCLQHQFKCSDAACDQIVKIFGKYFGNQATNFRQADKKIAKAAGTKMLRLNGCVNVRCEGHVFLPSDKATHCPKCNQARYDANGKPLEVSLLTHSCFYLGVRCVRTYSLNLSYLFINIHAESFLLSLKRPS